MHLIFVVCTKLIANQTMAFIRYEQVGKYFCTLFYFASVVLIYKLSPKCGVCFFCVMCKMLGWCRNLVDLH